MDKSNRAIFAERASNANSDFNIDKFQQHSFMLYANIMDAMNDCKRPLLAKIKEQNKIINDDTKFKAMRNYAKELEAKLKVVSPSVEVSKKPLSDWDEIIERYKEETGRSVYATYAFSKWLNENYPAPVPPLVIVSDEEILSIPSCEIEEDLNKVFVIKLFKAFYVQLIEEGAIKDSFNPVIEFYIKKHLESWKKYANTK